MFTSETAATRAKTFIDDILAPFHLIMNENKFSIEEHPQPFTDAWTADFHEFEFDKYINFKYKLQLREFTNRVVRNFRSTHDGRIPRYALQIIRPFEGKNTLDRISPFTNSKNQWGTFEEHLAIILKLDMKNIDVVTDIVNYYTYQLNKTDLTTLPKVILSYLATCDINHCY